MIKINNIIFDKNSKFPDGTRKLILSENDMDYILKSILIDEENFLISWNFENESEILDIFYLKKMFDEILDNTIKTYLEIGYMPQARMDRTYKDNECFTLKYLADFINSMNFDKVWVFDPHSNVCSALINKCIVDSPEDFFHFNVLDKLNKSPEEMVLYFPDASAFKKYGDEECFEHYTKIFGNKKRNWETGKILGIEIIGDKEAIKGKDILMIDDICSYGGTFYYGAKALREYGVKDCYLAVSHCEENYDKRNLLTEIKTVYTTNSIIRNNNDNEQLVILNY